MGSKRRRGEVRCFLPAGRSCPCLYAVTLKDLPGVVKVGRSSRWATRRKTYAEWNLRGGDGIEDEVVFEIHEEWCDLEALEAAVIAAVPFPRRHGFEWFMGDIETAAQVISGVLEGAGCFHTERWAYREEEA